MELDGRTAVVTGAASGIGLALSERLLAEGMSVVMADIEATPLQREAGRLHEHGGRVLACTCDVSDAEQVDALRVRSLEEFGAVHLLCNNAGVASGQPSASATPGEWRWVVGVNLLGVAYGVGAFARGMVEQGEGHIVNTSSEAGLCASPMVGPYHASKYAVVGLSESLAMELEGTGVGVSCLCPELVATRIFEATRNAPDHLRLPPPRPLDIEQIARMMGTVAMDPLEVAVSVIDAVRAERFWIITHEVTRARVRYRNQSLEIGRNPRYPAAGGSGG